MCLKCGVTSLHILSILVPRFSQYMTMLVVFKWLLSTPQEKTEVETPVLPPLDLDAPDSSISSAPDTTAASLCSVSGYTAVCRVSAHPVLLGESAQCCQPSLDGIRAYSQCNRYNQYLHAMWF